MASYCKKILVGAAFLFGLFFVWPVRAQSEPISNIYPNLALFGDSRNYLPTCCNETGIGSVVWWSDRLWAITYPPHEWNGSFDYLYEISYPALNLIKRTDVSVGGTHAARMIHTESNQLIIGPYFISSTGTVRRVPPAELPGRLTAVTRHLSDPANKVYFYTMEQGIYEVNVHTLAVTELHIDANKQVGGVTNIIPNPVIPGAHGKSAYTGQGRLMIANNGYGGGLGEWNGQGNPGTMSSWTVVDQNKYTEITGPGGINGAPSPTSPVWAMGWDAKSNLLNVLTNGQWQRFRLPKASYTYDDDTGWFTEWPRIHKYDQSTFIMDLYGMFLNMPAVFSSQNSQGIRPISQHLSIINDIARVNNQLFMARNDQSSRETQIIQKPQSNFLTTTFGGLSEYGRPYGNGGPWVNDTTVACQVSEPYLFSTFEKKSIHLSHANSQNTLFMMDLDTTGNGNWSTYKTVLVPPNGYSHIEIPQTVTGEWIRFRTDINSANATAYLRYETTPPVRDTVLFEGLATPNRSLPRSEGILRTKDEKLQVVAKKIDASGSSANTLYEIDGSLQLKKITDQGEMDFIVNNVAQTTQGYSVDSASVVVTDSQGRRFRLPKSDPYFDNQWSKLYWPRFKNNPHTDRYLFNAHGTMYEAARNNVNQIEFQKLKPITTHRSLIYDFTSWRGLLVMSGLFNEQPANNNIVVSDDNALRLWIGSGEDLWKLGAPSGYGGPWINKSVTTNEISDPYLMAGYTNKKLEISHTSSQNVPFVVEVDPVADNTWKTYATFTVRPGQTFTHEFPDGYNVHWVRMKSGGNTTVTTRFTYGSGHAYKNTDIATVVKSYKNTLDNHYQPIDSLINSMDIAYVIKEFQNPSLPTPPPVPKNKLKQTLLSSDGKKVWIRYNRDDGTWTNWGDLSEDLSAVCGSAGCKSYDQVRMVDDSHKIKQSVVLSDGRTYKYRYCYWNGTIYGSCDAWADDATTLSNIPTSGSNLSFHNLDHAILPPDTGNQNRMKQSVIRDGGMTMWWRRGYWNGTSYTNWSNWAEDPVFATIQAAGFAGYDQPRSMSHTWLDNGDIKQVVLSNNGTKLISRTLSNGTWTNWGQLFGEQQLNNLIPCTGSNQSFLSYDEITMP